MTYKTALTYSTTNTQATKMKHSCDLQHTTLTHTMTSTEVTKIHTIDLIHENTSMNIQPVIKIIFVHNTDLHDIKYQHWQHSLTNTTQNIYLHELRTSTHSPEHRQYPRRQSHRVGRRKTGRRGEGGAAAVVVGGPGTGITGHR